jgi:hypothetical protein
MVVPTEGCVHTVASAISAERFAAARLRRRTATRVVQTRIRFHSPDQGLLESALLDRERRGVQP